MNEKKREWFFMNRYVLPSEFEAKMEQMAAEGWQADAFGIGSSLSVTFRKTTPKRYKYVMDFKFFPGKTYQKEHALQGWEYFGRVSNCLIWRKACTDEKPASFLDKTAERARDTKLFHVFLLPFMLLAVLLFFSMSTAATHPDAPDIAGIFFVAGVSVVAMIYVGWVLLKLRTHLKRNAG